MTDYASKFPPRASEVTFTERVLERAKVAANVELSPQMAHDFRAEAHADAMTQRAVISMRSYVMRERLLTDDQSAEFEREVVIEQPAARGLWPMHVVALGGCALAITTGSLPAFLLACAVALAWVIAYAANPPKTHRRTVAGTVTIPVTSYATFPENTTVYPPELGAMVRVMEPEPPWWEDYKAVER